MSFLWESEAENRPDRSLSLTLLGGGRKDYLGVPFCYCITVAGGSRGAVTRGGLSSHPCKHFYKHIDATSETHTGAHTSSARGRSHEAGQACVKKPDGLKRVNGIRKVNTGGGGGTARRRRRSG